jgi:hypothetical protein
MTRTLTFDGPRGAKRFELVWLSLMNGGDGKGDRSPAIIRKEARLQNRSRISTEPTTRTRTPRAC